MNFEKQKIYFFINYFPSTFKLYKTNILTKNILKKIVKNEL